MAKDKTKALEELSKSLAEISSMDELAGEIKDLKSTIIDQNEELIVTFVEGTKRIIKKPSADLSPDIKSLKTATKESLQSVESSIDSLKRGIGEVERAVKSIKLPSTVDFRATGAMLKLPIKELTRAVRDQELPRSAKDPIAVRLSDGEEFYKALDTVIQQISGGGATSYAFDKQDSSPTKAATVAVTISGKSRDVLAVVNTDGTSLGGGVQYTENDIDATPTGNLMMIFDDGADRVSAISESNPMPIADNGGSITIDDGGGNLNVQTDYNEDGAHITGASGFFAMGVRNDIPNTATTSLDGDYSQISTYRTGAVRTAIPEEDFAALGSNHVKKYYTNAGAVTDGIVWSPAAGKRWYVTDIFIGVSAAATVTLEDDKVGGDEAVFKHEFAANSGWSHTYGTPLFSGEDAADLLITTSAGNCYITVTGYEI